MTTAEFAARVKRDYPALSHCYIAVMENDRLYDLEVEVSDGEIAGTYATNSGSLVRARQLADALDGEFEAIGVNVFKDRDAWREHLEGEDEDDG